MTLCNHVYLAQLNTANGNDSSDFVTGILADSDPEAHRIARAHNAKLMALHDGDRFYKVVNAPMPQTANQSGVTKVTNKNQPCQDSEGLGLNVPDSVKAPGFVPTRHELIQLVKYWAPFDLDNRFFNFLYPTDSTDSRLGVFARRRIARIATVLGDEEVRKAIEKVEQRYSDHRAWAIFKNGTVEEKEAFYAELAAEEKASKEPETAA